MGKEDVVNVCWDGTVTDFGNRLTVLKYSAIVSTPQLRSTVTDLVSLNDTKGRLTS